MFLYFNFFLCIVWGCNVVLSIPITVKSTMEHTGVGSVSINVQKEDNKTVNLQQIITKVTESDAINMQSKIPANISRIRVKRQTGGAGKFVEASEMPQLKLLRLFLQMFRNSWDSAYIGGAHPLHHNVPKTIIALYKQKVVEFFFPDVGEDTKKTEEY